MNNTPIAWTQKTWNAYSGCLKVSEGCQYCYANTLAEKYRETPAFPNGFDLTIREHKFTEPLKLKEPTLIFINSMSDFFLKDSEFDLEPGTMDGIRDRLIDIMEQTPHEYQVLTKRPDELLRYSQRRELPGNFWAGVSLDTSSHYDRVDILRQVDAEIRFLSVEPMLSEMPALDLSGIHWVIGGGESGLHLMDEKVRAKRGMADRSPKGKWTPRADRYHWATGLRDRCIEQDVRFFWKQWGGVTPTSAGRELEGRTWDEFPRLPGGKEGAIVGSDHRLKIGKPAKQLELV
jgi:protein gp37